MRQAARKRKQERFTALFHHLNIALLRDSFYALKRQASPGVDGVTWQEYETGGMTNLCEAQNAELAGMERILEHWRDLEYREPTLRIVCPEDHSRRRFGLFPSGCPNLVFELMRTRRAQLSASQLMRKNPTEAIVDKDNHLRDCLKYVGLSRPAPAEVPHSITRERIIQEAFQDGTFPSLAVRIALLDEQERRESEPISYVSRLPRWSD